MKTKRLSLLLILALIITIGGVYATWMYSETPMTAVHGHVGSFGLANASVNNSKGNITVNAEGAHLVIDQTAADDYSAKLTATGNVVFTFTPSEVFASSNAGLASIEMQYSLTTTNADPTAFENNDGTGAKAMFTKFDTASKIDVELVKDGSVYTATIPASDLLDLIEINDFTLDSYDDYEAFSATLGTFGNIGVSLAEKTAP